MGDDLKTAALTPGGEDVDPIALDGPDGLDRLSAAVLERFSGIPESEAIHDPHGTLFAVAASVERSIPSASSRSSDATLGDEAKLFLQRCVQALEPQCKEMLLLHVNEGLTYKQIAARLGRSTEYVLRHLVRAYSTLRNQRSAVGALHGVEGIAGKLHEPPR